jgi:8-oxo-dGTP pyrophosphatase MutT (NUDIX family)
MMTDKQLTWEITETRLLLRTPVFDVLEQDERAAAGPAGTYVAMTAPDWVMVIPVLGEDFLLVRQWRHAARQLTTEFPGGVRDGDEDPAGTAARELLEETGFRAGKLTRLGSCSPNPALFANTFHCYLAEDLIPTGEQHLDADELLNCERRPIREVVAAFGSPEFSHGLMGTALAFYLRRGL